MKKKGGIGIIILIILILIIASIGIYFLFIKDSRSISGYTYEIPNFNTKEICDYYDGYEGTICLKATDSVIYYSASETNDVILFLITKGLEEHKSLFKSSCDAPNECNHLRNVLISYPSESDRPTFSWYYSDNEFLRIKQWGNSIGSINSKTIEHYLDKYPPIEI